MSISLFRNRHQKTNWRHKNHPQVQKTEDMLINCRHFIEPNVDFAKQTCSPSPFHKSTVRPGHGFWFFTVLLQHHYILTVYKLLHYRKFKIQVSITIGVVTGVSDHTRKLVKYQSRKSLNWQVNPKLYATLLSTIILALSKLQPNITSILLPTLEDSPDHLVNQVSLPHNRLHSDQSKTTTELPFSFNTWIGSKNILRIVPLNDWAKQICWMGWWRSTLHNVCSVTCKQVNNASGILKQTEQREATYASKIQTDFAANA